MMVKEWKGWVIGSYGGRISCRAAFRFDIGPNMTRIELPYRPAQSGCRICHHLKSARYAGQTTRIRVHMTLIFQCLPKSQTLAPHGSLPNIPHDPSKLGYNRPLFRVLESVGRPISYALWRLILQVRSRGQHEGI